MGKPRFLVTGGTGFLGRHVIPLLKEHADVTVISRSDPKALPGDLSYWDGRLEPKKLRGSFDVMLHMAGLYNLRVQELESMRQNVMTTHSALAIAQKAEIPNFIHISTVAVAIGDRSFVVQPEAIDAEIMHPDFYSYGKAFSELMVRFWADGLKSKLILRPGVLVGDTKKGEILRIDGPYHAVEGLSKLKFLLDRWKGPIPLPGRADSRLPLVPVDVAAKAIVRLAIMSREENWTGTKSLHLTPPEGLSAEALYKSVFEHLGMKVGPITLFDKVPDALLKMATEALVDFPKEEMEYLLNFPRFDSVETKQLLGPRWCPEYHEYEKTLWKGYDEFIANRI